ncbi:MAG: hypothetical protein Q8Q23_05540 [bacterium]|nr:hypothetical protein [bacterium]
MTETTVLKIMNEIIVLNAGKFNGDFINLIPADIQNTEICQKNISELLLKIGLLALRRYGELAHLLGYRVHEIDDEMVKKIFSIINYSPTVILTPMQNAARSKAAFLLNVQTLVAQAANNKY